MKAKGAIIAPVLTPVMMPKSGRVPASLQPLSRPAAKAPFSPPPERTSQGCPAAEAPSRRVRKAAASSPGMRTPAARPSGRAVAASAAVKATRPDGVSAETCFSAAGLARSAANAVCGRLSPIRAAPSSTGWRKPVRRVDDPDMGPSFVVREVPPSIVRT